jgi:hypothetical protein
VKGGKRKGAGRPVAEPVSIIRLRLPVTTHNKIIELGGNVWLKRIISEALEAAKVE